MNAAAVRFAKRIDLVNIVSLKESLADGVPIRTFEFRHERDATVFIENHIQRYLRRN